MSPCPGGDIRGHFARQLPCNLLHMADDLSPLEHDVIATVLAPDHPVMNALRRQFERCHAASRRFTGVGFFTVLYVAPDVEPAPVKPGAMDLGDVTATIEGLEHGAGFVLVVQDGVLHVLEGFSYDEPWPDSSTRHEVIAGGLMHGGGAARPTWNRSMRLGIALVTLPDTDRPERDVARIEQSARGAEPRRNPAPSAVVSASSAPVSHRPRRRRPSSSRSCAWAVGRAAPGPPTTSGPGAGRPRRRR